MTSRRPSSACASGEVAGMSRVGKPPATPAGRRQTTSTRTQVEASGVGMSVKSDSFGNPPIRIS